MKLSRKTFVKSAALISGAAYGYKKLKAKK